MSSPKLWNRNTASRLARGLAAFPVPVLVILVGLFMATGPEAVFEPPWLLTLLNVGFLSLIPAAIVYITIKAYLGSGSMGLLGLSCGAFLMGLSASMTGLLIGDADGPNKAVTFYNMGFFLAGAFHCAGAAVVLTGIEPESSPRRRRIIVAVLYLGMVLVMGLWFMAALKGFTPVFFIQGVGATLIRQVVLGSAVGLFAASAGLVGLLYLRSRAPFQFWYGLGLFLIAIGLFCVIVPKTVGGPIGWLGRSAQYLGALYFLVAVASVVRGIRAGGVVLGEGISGLFQHRLEKLVAERTRELTIINERLKYEISERKQAEEALQKAHDELEQRVGERTADLVREIRERKKGEAEQEKLQAQLSQSQRMESIGVLAGGVAHDFNNLLTAIIGNAQLALADLATDNPLREDLEEIRKAGERGAMLTRQLMTFSRREPRYIEVLDLNDVVQDMDKLIRRLLRESIELRTIRSPGLWKVQADVGQMEQVIMNLAVNARDVMAEGGTLTVETANVNLDAAFFAAHDIDGEPGPYVMLAVTDTGSGMDKTIRERIFEPFFTTKERGTGTGLGLSTVYGIVKQAGGYIWPYSEPGMGTTMKIYLPRAEDAPRTILNEETTDKEAGGEVVLVAEDNAPLRELALKTLQKAGYGVLSAVDGEEALRVSETFKGEIHLLLTDVVMPRMGGQELAGRIRTLRPGIKVIYMSGFPDRDLSHAGALDSYETFLQKPFTPDALCLKVRKTMNSEY